MTARLTTLLIWALLAASAVAWGLRLFTAATPVPAGAAVAAAPLAAAGDLSRVLGTPPVEANPGEAPALPADSRFHLVGVVAPRGAAEAGLALISVDGKPPRAWAVGREIEPGLRLLKVSHREVELGVASGTPAMTLSLPALAEPQRGVPGAATGPVPNAAPGIFRPGQPARGAAPPPAVPMPPQPVPGIPVDATEPSPAEAQDAGNAPATGNYISPRR